MGKNLEKYKIETSTDITLVRDKIAALFDSSNHALKGKFIGAIKGDVFKGSTNYSVNIDVTGSVSAEDGKTMVNMTIADNSPNYNVFVNVLLILIVCIVTILNITNENASVFSYVIPFVFALGTWGALKLKTFVLKLLKPKLRDSAEHIAKEIDGVVMIVQ